MVWAAEFVLSLRDDLHSSVAARNAGLAVIKLRDNATEWLARAGDRTGEPSEALSMLIDMRSGGADR